MSPFLCILLIALLRDNVVGEPASFPQGVNVTAFEVYIPGLQKPVCFDLPLIPSKRYVLIDIKTNNFEYRLVGKVGNQMISNLTVYNNGSESTYVNGDVPYGQIYQSSMGDRLTVKAFTSPSGIRIVVAAGSGVSALGRVGGLLALSTQVRGKVIQKLTAGDGVMTSTIEMSAGPKLTTIQSVLVKSLYEQSCWYLSKKDVLLFGLNVNDFEVA